MSKSNHPRKEPVFQISNLAELLEKQDAEMEDLFVKTINLYASPNSGGQSEREKIDQLRLAVEKSIGGSKT